MSKADEQLKYTRNMQVIRGSHRCWKDYHFGAYSFSPRGLTHKIGEVRDGAATMEWMEQEQERVLRLLLPLRPHGGIMLMKI